MANKTKGSARTSVEGINDSLSSIEQKLENNQKYIYYALIAVAVVILAVGGYLWYRSSAIEKGNKEIGKADIQLLMYNNPDSALTLYKRVAERNSFGPANRAAQMAATILFQKGKYDEALKYLKKSKPEGDVAGPAMKSLEGDCYVNKSQAKGGKQYYNEALSAYDFFFNDAATTEIYTPVFMLKKATVLHANAKYADELKVYEDMKQQFPTYALQNRINLDKYIERAKALAGK